MTIAEVYMPAIMADSQEKANRILHSIALEIIHLQLSKASFWPLHSSYEDIYKHAIDLAKENIRFYAGYFDEAARCRVNEFYQ